jgi:type I restriction enzyme, R subunit
MHALRIHRADDVPAGPVFARPVDALQHDQKRVLMICVERALKFADAMQMCLYIALRVRIILIIGVEAGIDRGEVHRAHAQGDETGARTAQDEIEALLLFKNDMGAFQRMYSFLAQMFDYGNTDIEKRFIFYKRLTPLLEFGREREGVDLSQVKLTHHSVKSQGRQPLVLGGEAPKLAPLTEAGSGAINEKEKARLADIIERVNGLFEGDLTDDDQLVYVNNVIKGKLLECQELVEQAANNTKAQFANSPTLAKELLNAVMDALAAHTTMSKQALESERVREGLKDVLLGPAELYEALRAKADQCPRE